jgi:hypothetical protein
MMEDPIRAAARERVAELVRNFQRNEVDYLRAAYNETQARTDFITPLLEAFGWDVHNVAGHPMALREVIEEATIEVGESGSQNDDQITNCGWPASARCLSKPRSRACV